MLAPPQSPHSGGFVRFGVFEFDPETGDLWKSGRHVRLADQPRQVLRTLVSRPGELVSREELRRALWPDDTFVDFETGLNVIINRIRQALDDSASTPRYIETFTRRGYRFIAPIGAAPTPEAATAGASASAGTAHDTSESMTRQRVRIGRSATIALLGLAAAGTIVGFVAWQGAWGAARVPLIRSVAVLPLRDVSPDPKEAWFAEGMTDAVITDLGRISALRVISRQSTKTLRDSPDSLDAISRKLGADALIEGSAALANGRVRLTVRLVHGATDRQLWTGTYERPLSDVLTLQGELAQAVADAVRITVTADQQKALAGRRPVAPEAYMLYLRAGHFFNLRGTENVRKSVDYYQQAFARDPGFAAAYGGLALSYCLLIGTVPADDAFRPVKAAAAQALALDPTQADALVAMSQAAFYADRDWRAAKRMLSGILHQYPNHATAHLWYASVLTEIGPLEEAITERRRALTLDPLAIATIKSLGEVLLQTGGYAEAVTAFRSALELDPDYAEGHGWLGFAYLKMGHREEGIAELERSAQLSNNSSPMVAWLAHAYGLVARHADGHRLLQTLANRSRTEWVSPMHFARVHAGLGEFDRAFAYLDDAYTRGSPALIRLKSDPLLDPLKGDPRFAALVRRLNLPWP